MQTAIDFSCCFRSSVALTQLLTGLVTHAPSAMKLVVYHIAYKLDKTYHQLSGRIPSILSFERHGCLELEGIGYHHHELHYFQSSRPPG